MLASPAFPEALATSVLAQFRHHAERHSRRDALRLLAACAAGDVEAARAALPAAGPEVRPEALRVAALHPEVLALLTAGNAQHSQ